MKVFEEYIPETPEDLVGGAQRKLASSLLQDLENGIIHQKLLFIGPSGVGKTTIATMYAKKLLEGSSLSVAHVNCNEVALIDWVRNRFLPTWESQPITGKYKVWFLDEIHGFKGKAREAILPQLDAGNMPEHLIILAATTDPDDMPETLISRFSQYVLPRPSQKEIASFMMKLFESYDLYLEGTDGVPKGQTYEGRVARDILERSSGNIRSIVSYVGQVVNGSYTLSTYAEDSDPESLPFQFLYKGIPYSKAIKLFRASSDDPDAMASKLVAMAIKAVEDEKGGKNTQDRSRGVIRYLGGGLPVQYNAYDYRSKESALLKALLFVLEGPG